MHLHRDPVASIGSGASLNATLHAMHSDAVDRCGSARSGSSGWAGPTTEPSRPGPVELTSPAWSRTSRSRTWSAAPLAEVARIYDAAGLDLAPAAEAAMRGWLAARPHEAGARPDYSPETYGLSAGQIRERFAAYDAAFRS